MGKYNVTIIIPSLNPDEKLVGTVTELYDAGFDDIVIIDDGSDEAHKAFFPDLSEFPYCTLIHHDVNKGKGAALKTAFGYVIKHRDYQNGVVTVDADGQHLAKDVIACAKQMAETGTVVLGCRNFSEPHVPKRSRFGNKTTSFVFKTLCGFKISDTQTGLRAIPNKFLPSFLEVKGDRYEYETNMLLEFKKQGIPYSEQPISTVYLNENKGSHFRPIRDSLRVYKFILYFVMSSLISTVVDIVLFYIVLKFLFGDLIQGKLLATILARVCSATVNFTINRKTVFSSKAGVFKTLVKYIALAIPILLTSAYSITAISWLLHIQNELIITLVKIVIDALLFMVSFRIQQNWVFANKPKGKGIKK